MYIMFLMVHYNQNNFFDTLKWIIKKKYFVNNFFKKNLIQIIIFLNTNIK